MNSAFLLRPLSAILCVVVSTGLSNAQTFYGPSHYYQLSDSPFSSFGDLRVEDFEDGPSWNFVGVTYNIGDWTRTTFPQYVDSVDFDDGMIDGSGANGNSWFVADHPNTLILNFVESTLGGLPQHAGLVATDGIGQLWFRAYGRSGQLLGEVNGDHFNPLAGGDTAEDRFYGVSYIQGISRLEVTGNSLEIDHIQFVQPVPEPASMTALALGAFCLLKRKSK